jgi:hypothetical protein
MSYSRLFERVAVFLNTIFRITPGLMLYVIFSFFLMLFWAQGFYLLFSPYMVVMSTYPLTMVNIWFNNLFIDSDFKKLVSNPS